MKGKPRSRKEQPLVGELEGLIEGFGDVVDEYERGRPGYPSEAIDLLTKVFSIGPSSRILDVGAGTGKLTRQLLDTGAKVTALEPVDAMRQKLMANLGSAEILAGKAESIPLPDDSIDLIACGQSFHWFRTQEALRDFFRVLRRGGGLALLWNTHNDSVGWVKRVREVMKAYEPRSRDLDASSTWQSAFRQSNLFLPLERAEFRHLQPMNEAVLLAWVKSRSYIASLEPEIQQQAINRVCDVVRGHPDLAGKKRFELPYVTELYFSRAVD